MLRLVEKPDAEAIALPATLSETGVFRELATLTPHEGIEPYEINVPFWSDHAQKKRWFSLPELTQKSHLLLFEHVAFSQWGCLDQTF